jgi:hypothetical protein
MSDAKLREYLEFDESDLRANQGGKVSDKQKLRLAQRRKSGAKQWTIVFGLLLVIPVALLFWFFKSTLAGGLNFADQLKAYAVPIILVSFVVLFVGYVLYSAISSKRDDTLKYMEGEVEYVRVERKEKDYARSDSHHDMYKTVQAYELRLGSSTLGDVDKAMMDVVKQGDVYKFYYTPEGGILSAERVKTGR